MRAAIVHERFTELGGAERVVEQLHRIWPTAPIYTTVLDRASLTPALANADIRPSPLQRLYRGGRGYAHLLPLLPMAISRIDVGDVDVVITSHHAFSNRVRPPPTVPVLSYTYTPARWIWDPDKLTDERGGRLGRLALSAFARTQRSPDRAAAARLRGIVVDSRHVAARVARWWGRGSEVVPAPVDVDRFTPDPTVHREEFFLAVGRLVPYKRPLAAVAAARLAGAPLVIAGEGRLRNEVTAVAGAGVEVLGEVDDATLVDLYRRCRALVFPGEEDFGIVPVEAQACGTPVLARAVGGALETVVDRVTGHLYGGPGPGDDVEELAAAMREFDPKRFDPEAARRHAETFAPERFRAAMVGAVEQFLASPA